MKQTRENGKITKQISTGQIKKEGLGGASVKRNYKSTVFAMLFGDRERLLKLYNAISGKNYQEPEALEINTLDNAIYIGMKNDLSFIIDEQALPLRTSVHGESQYAAALFVLYLRSVFRYDQGRKYLWKKGFDYSRPLFRDFL